MPEPRPRFDAPALQPFVEDALAEEEADPMAVSFDEPPPPEKRKLFRKVGLPMYGAGTALDLLGTYQALGRAGTQEGNPMFGGMGRGGLVGANAAISALIALGLDRLAKKHDGAATLASGIIGGGRGASGVHNMTMGQR